MATLLNNLTLNSSTLNPLIKQPLTLQLAVAQGAKAQLDPQAFAVIATEFATASALATFASGVLSVFGDASTDTLTIARDAAGRLLINGGAVAISGGTATVANTSLLQVFGQGGDDVLTLDETQGALPSANMFGGSGNDRLIGGSGADLLFGQAGDDTLLGKGGNDLLFGGDGKDVLTGGAGNDQVFGQAGDDRLIWNPGDGSDLFEGGDGNDTAEINGGNGAETFTATANGARVRVDRVDPAPFSIDAGTIENFVINLNGGDDQFTAGNGLAALARFTVDGGTGNDTITGGDGNDTLLGGDGNDLIQGGRGNDVALLGAGDDSFVWNPGDGSDTVEGQAGSDTLRFNGANIAERIDLAANGSRVRLARDIANIVMDANDMEVFEINAVGGSDAITVGDLTGTDARQVAIHLAGSGGAGDGAADTVSVNAGNAADSIVIVGSGASVSVSGLAARTSVDGLEGANDTLVINAFAGNDRIDASSLPAGTVKLTIDAGAGNDTVIGSAGNDILIGGDGNDTITGGRGNDTAFMGAGDDTFIWNPGDGSDIVEGQDGKDTLQFNGANVAERIEVAANGSRVLMTRDVGNVVMDLNGIERIDLHALGGADNVHVGDLSGTTVTELAIDMGAANGSADGQADLIGVDGTAGDDVVRIAGGGAGFKVIGLHAQIDFSHLDISDRLTISGLAGSDVIDASAFNGGLQLELNGGAGADKLIGSFASDLTIGGTGNDTALMGGGDDTFVWNPGDGSDIVEGQAGNDTLQFNGANVAERINIAANGSRVHLTRDIGNITMDLNSTELVAVKTLGGADTVIVDDLGGTATKEVHIDLGNSAGGGDGQSDTVIVNATGGSDVVTLQLIGGSLVINGLAAHIVIDHFEPGDRLQINLLGGDDVLDASALTTPAMQLFGFGGDGNDVLIGSAGNDTLNGDAGDDVLNGGPGLDVLDGGAGNNVTIQMVGIADDTHASF